MSNFWKFNTRQNIWKASHSNIWGGKWIIWKYINLREKMSWILEKKSIDEDGPEWCAQYLFFIEDSVCMANHETRFVTSNSEKPCSGSFCCQHDIPFWCQSEMLRKALLSLSHNFNCLVQNNNSERIWKSYRFLLPLPRIAFNSVQTTGALG